MTIFHYRSYARIQGLSIVRMTTTGRKKRLPNSLWGAISFRESNTNYPGIFRVKIPYDSSFSLKHLGLPCRTGYSANDAIQDLTSLFSAPVIHQKRIRICSIPDTHPMVSMCLPMHISCVRTNPFSVEWGTFLRIARKHVDNIAILPSA